MYDEARITVEIVSAIMCFILVKFMIKPYQLTREGRYLGLPLGFLFLGASFTISSITISAGILSTPRHFYSEFSWLQLFIRTFAFVFLAVTYYFSKKPSKNSRIIWDLTYSVLAVILLALLFTVFVSSQSTLEAYSTFTMYIRIFNIACLTYVAIHTIRSHVNEADPTTIWTPSGFILLGISQYSLLFYNVENALPLVGALSLRLLALTVFLYVAYQTFYSKKEKKEP